MDFPLTDFILFIKMTLFCWLYFFTREGEPPFFFYHRKGATDLKGGYCTIYIAAQHLLREPQPLDTEQQQWQPSTSTCIPLRRRTYYRYTLRGNRVIRRRMENILRSFLKARRIARGGIVQKLWEKLFPRSANPFFRRYFLFFFTARCVCVCVCETQVYTLLVD